MKNIRNFIRFLCAAGFARLFMVDLFQTKKVFVATIIAFVAFLISLSGCSQQLSENERTELARLYAEILIAEQEQRDDTGVMNNLLDTLFDRTDYSSVHDVEQRIKELAKEDPDGLRAMFDSTQRALERIRDRKSRDTSTSVSEQGKGRSVEQ